MSLDAFLTEQAAVIRARIERVAGSAPREAGAEMFVAAGAAFGTIGGGRMELVAMEAAREMLATGGTARRLDLPLGPEIGQCCGGRVVIALERLDAEGRAAALARAAREAAARPFALVHGAGPVGRALAAALSLLPVRVRLIDGRAGELARLDPAVAARVETRLSALPEGEARAAPAGAAHLIATHDHGLDFLIAMEALARGDAAHVGMIGSASKRASFARRARAAGLDPAALVCPIGAGAPDKRPEVIAAFAAAEAMAALAVDAARRDAPPLRALGAGA